MFRLFSIFYVSFWVTFGVWPDQALAQCIKPWNPPHQGIKDLYTEVSLIGPDDRQVRTQQNAFTSSVESSQGRIWCGPKALKKAPTKRELQKGGFVVENATLFLDRDIVLTNRHMFETQTGLTGRNPKNCWFEHLSTGKIIAITSDIAYPPINGSNLAASCDQDVAILRLSTPVEKATPLAESDIIINHLPDAGRSLKVISNYAANYAPQDALTMTNCQVMVHVSNHGKPTSFAATDCDTGFGTSGAQVYVQDDGRPKLSGIVTGQMDQAAPGSPYDSFKNSTLVTFFDDSLMETYRKVRASFPPPSS